MRMIVTILFASLAIAAGGFLGIEKASAAPSRGPICTAAAAASMVSKVHCRVVRKCGYFGCSYEEVCT
jgi:hypothetical protein